MIDLGFNNIEYVPSNLNLFPNLEKLFLNNNPIQFIPIEIAECCKLKVIDLSRTYVKTIPRDLVRLRKTLYILNLDHCPLNQEMKLIYEEGIIALFEFL